MEVVKRNESELTDLITNDQLFEKGIDGKGRSLGEYSPFTIDIKRFKNQPFDRVTLKDEGDFHKSFFLNTNKFPLFTDATDQKTGELTDRYGDAILDFAPETLPKVDEQLKDDLIKMFNNGIQEALQEL